MEGDGGGCFAIMPQIISIHSLRMEGDRRSFSRAATNTYFNPLPPHGGRREWKFKKRNGVRFQSTPSAWRETPVRRQGSLLEDISIHSLRMEGDFFTFWNQSSNTHFNPLPPHGGRPTAFCVNVVTSTFQSTPSTRRETQLAVHDTQALVISIHSLHTEGDTLATICQRNLCISIHSLHTEGDNVRKYDLFEVVYFNPLPPHGGRLAVHMQLTIRDLFQSTPSTRRETVPRRPSGGQQKNFNPLPPHGGRLTDHVDRIKAALFQSTPSTRRETQYSVSEDGSDGISIHSLHTEGDGNGGGS